ncbi:MAG: threonine synthase [Candidatus Marinimicrobia bacterium]|nr:threonine synthase [Candidatus Neomarinimicrobiota bacterium]
MRYYSTQNPTNKMSLKNALFKGLAPDKGLYMPEHIPSFDKKFITSLTERSFQEICFHIASLFLSDDIDKHNLRKIVETSINFDAPLIKLNENTHILELWHGPTLAFKDFGARFMAQLMGHFLEDTSKPLHILVATSGDTGSAIANSFLGVEGIKVSVLFPKNRVSNIQEQQFTTLGENITALEVDGSFDDCQRLVKTAFLDKKLNKALRLTSANSINIGRLIPQTFYYVYAFSQLKNTEDVVISVPSGNFGNLTAGIIAMKMGLPVKKFIASTNINKIFPTYLRSGVFTPSSSAQTISNAMDVGNPSNFERIVDLFHHSFDKVKDAIIGFYFTDDETRSAMQQMHSEFDYIVDPHGAVGYIGLINYLKKHPENKGICLGTAHPAKFLNVVEPTLKTDIKVPNRLQSFMMKQKKSVQISNVYGDFANQMFENN